MNNLTVWKVLNHDSVLTSVEETLQKKLSNLILQRNSYINRVYELEEFDSCDRFIVKFYRPNRWTREMILEEHKLLEDLENKEISVIPPTKINNQTLFEFNNIFFALFPKKSGRPLDEFDKDKWEELGRLLARVHSVSAQIKDNFRVVWRPAVSTAQHLKVLLETNFLLPGFREPFQKIVDLFIKKADPAFDNQEFILIHGDCHRGNLIHRPGEGIYIIDFDDICMGLPVQDLWMLLPDIPENCENEINWFLKGYEIFRFFGRQSLELVQLLRGMRLIHFVSWLSIQSAESDFQTHFPKAGTAPYWNELMKEIQEITYLI